MANSKKPPRTPKFRHHKASGQGFVELEGHRYYLGKFGLPETQEAYHRMAAEWIASGRSLVCRIITADKNNSSMIR